MTVFPLQASRTRLTDLEDEMKNRTIKAALLAGTLICALFVLYGLAKLAQARSTDLKEPVVADIPGVEVSRPVDEGQSRRALVIFVASGMGLVLCAGGYVYMLRNPMTPS